MQQNWLQATVSCNMCTGIGVAMRGSWQLSGQRQVLRLLPASLQ